MDQRLRYDRNGTTGYIPSHCTTRILGGEGGGFMRLSGMVHSQSPQWTEKLTHEEHITNLEYSIDVFWKLLVNKFFFRH